MRTDLTVDPDVERLLRAEARRRHRPVRRILNDAIRDGLAARQAPTKPFRPLTFDMGTPKVDLTKALALADELQDMEILRQLVQRQGIA